MGLLVNGGGGVPKSRLRAAATAALNVLRGTFFVASSGQLTEGTMNDNQGKTVEASVAESAAGSNVPVIVPERACYDTSSRLTIPFSDFGNAVASDLVADKNMTSAAGFKVSGTMQDYSGQAVNARVVDKNGANIRMRVPNTGKYSNASYVQAAATVFGDATAADVDSSVTFTSAAGLIVQGTGKKLAVSGATNEAQSSGGYWSFNAIEGAIYAICVQSVYAGCGVTKGELIARTSGSGYYVHDNDGTIGSKGVVTLLIVRATEATIQLEINSNTWAGSRKCWVRIA